MVSDVDLGRERTANDRFLRNLNLPIRIGMTSFELAKTVLFDRMTFPHYNQQEEKDSLFFVWSSNTRSLCQGEHQACIHAMNEGMNQSINGK